MSSEVLARLASLLDRVVARRALPRTVAAAPAAAPIVATSPAPRAITPVVITPVVITPVVDAPEPEIIAEAPVAEAPKPVVVEAAQPVVIEPVVETPVPDAPMPLTAPVEPTLVSRRALEPFPSVPSPAAAPAKTSLPLPETAQIRRADDRVAASFAAGLPVSPGLGDDEADHVETLAFRVGRALPKPGQVPAPPLPVTTREEPGERRSDPGGERRSERFSPSLPTAPIAAPVVEPAAKPTPASLRSLLQRSVALRPRG